MIAEAPGASGGSGTQKIALRYRELDSLRGLAALSVVLAHYVHLFPQSESQDFCNRYWFLWHTPLHALWAGAEAVMLFFVLSGFVLSMPFLRGDVPVGSFLIKRVLRIYPAYWAACSLAFVCRAVIGDSSPLHGVSDWFNGIWSSPVTPAYAWHQYLLVGSWDNGDLFPVVWSLVHEMRISLLFPLSIVPGIRYAARLAVAAVPVAYVTGAGALFVSRRLLHGTTDYADTLVYVPAFLLGAGLAYYHVALVRLWSGLGVAAKAVVLLLAVSAYTLRYWCWPHSVASVWIGGFTAMLACCVYIIAALGGRWIGAALCLRPLVVLGDWSYPVYLTHTIVLTTMVRTLWPRLPAAWAILPVSFAITLCLSMLMHRYLELPFIQAGRALSRKLQP